MRRPHAASDPELVVAPGSTETQARDASPTERRFFNQTFFERIEIREDDVADVVLAQPIRALLDDELIEALATSPDEQANSRSGVLSGPQGPKNGPSRPLWGPETTEPLTFSWSGVRLGTKLGGSRCRCG